MSYAENGKFKIQVDGIDPEKIPFHITRNGHKIPAIGLGTYGLDRYTAEEVSSAVISAAEVGYRHFDCASAYGNEKQIGGALKIIMDGGVFREDLHITSKVWNDMHDDVVKSCRQSLEDLNLDFLDLYLVHWPFPSFYESGYDTESRSPDAEPNVTRPYIHENFMETWAQMEELVDLGFVKEIGTSNFTSPKLKKILRDARIKPAVNEMELHPHFQQQAFFNFLTSNNIVPIGFAPIGSPNRHECNGSKGAILDIEDPAITGPAKRLGVHPAVICVKWGWQRGYIPIPFSTHRKKFLANLKAVVNDPLTVKEMAAIAKADKNHRLFKGEVFLWKDGLPWEALWDPDGEITDP